MKGQVSGETIILDNKYYRHSWMDMSQQWISIEWGVKEGTIRLIGEKLYVARSIRNVLNIWTFKKEILWRPLKAEELNL